MELKPGVRIHGIKPEMVVALLAIDQIWGFHGYDPVITSAVDGKHSRGSLHYVGLALDIRSRDIPSEKRFELADELKKALGADFDVVLERTHFHIEFQPKEPYTK